MFSDKVFLFFSWWWIRQVSTSQFLLHVGGTLGVKIACVKMLPVNISGKNGTSSWLKTTLSWLLLCLFHGCCLHPSLIQTGQPSWGVDGWFPQDMPQGGAAAILLKSYVIVVVVKCWNLYKDKVHIKSTHKAERVVIHNILKYYYCLIM